MEVVGRCTNPKCNREFFTLPKDMIDHYLAKGIDPKEQVVCNGKVVEVKNGRT